MANAQETKVAKTGFYTLDSFTTPAQYKNFSTPDKRNLLAKKDLVFLVGDEVYFAKDALGKSDAQLTKIAQTVGSFEKQYGELTNSGYGTISESFEVIGIE